ncbi:MAG: hypothetical protein K0R51_604 [Cytophagaceae bacterium]|nr:hypothetical protein [Cytophagaceae bacterium]
MAKRLIEKLERRFWKIDTHLEREYCVLYTTNSWAEDMEVEKNQFQLQNRLPFFYFFVEMESRYHYAYKIPVLLEPKRGWLIDEKHHTLFSRSFPYYNNPFSGRIYYPELFFYLWPFKKIKEVERAISIPYGWENYFHFFMETLPQFLMLQEQGIDKNVPVIIPQQAMSFSYVNDFFKLNPLLDGRTIIVQPPNEYIRVKRETHVFKEVGFSKEYIYQLLNGFYDQSFFENQGIRSIYLKRGADKQRALVNTLEIEQYLTGLGYEIIDAEKMCLAEQIELFSSASKIIGIHGAGLTNIIFRFGRPLEVIEIFPEGHAPEHYKILSATLGYNYSSITGLSLDVNKQFQLPLEKLKAWKSL